MLPFHDVCRDVMGTKSIAELGPWYLVVRGASIGVVGPLRASVSLLLLLLHGEEGLLMLHAV
jgi:hypothetical protein